jgi:regulator of sigma E protease
MTVIIFFIILAILILSHEFGHFIVAKHAGVRVDEFGLGFPPKIFGWKYGETEYTLNLLPLGGFVKIFGETPDEESLAGPDIARSLVHKSKWVQALVLVAGVTCNIILAWLLISIGFMIGLPTPADQIGKYDTATPVHLLITSVSPESPAYLAKLKAGDELVGLSTANNSQIATPPNPTPELIQQFIADHPNEKLTLNYRRGKIFKDPNVLLESVTVTPLTGIVSDRAAIGIGMDEIAQVRKPFFIALWEGLTLTLRLWWLTIQSLFTIIKDSFVGQQNVLGGITGPVGLVGLVGDAQTLGFIYLLSFTAFISINLAVINLVPFPALDGGRLLFLLIEKIKGSPISPKIANTLNYVGFGLLLLLMAFVTYHDIAKIF